jgi:hypothetical protein
MAKYNSSKNKQINSDNTDDYYRTGHSDDDNDNNDNYDDDNDSYLRNPQAQSSYVPFDPSKPKGSNITYMDDDESALPHLRQPNAQSQDNNHHSMNGLAMPGKKVKKQKKKLKQVTSLAGNMTRRRQQLNPPGTTRK